MNHLATPPRSKADPTNEVAPNSLDKSGEAADVVDLCIEESHIGVNDGVASDNGDLSHTIPDAPIGQKAAMAVAVVAPFIGLLVAVALAWQYGFMGWRYVAMLLVGWYATGLGITVGFHRLMSHRSFETYSWVRLFWMSLGALSVEGAPLTWCAVHRKHHGKSDQQGDPHSPHLHGDTFWGSIKGFFYGHCGWLFAGYWSRPELERYVPDLLKDRFLVWCNNVYWFYVLASLAIPAVLGFGIAFFLGETLTQCWIGAGLGVLWGGLARIFVTHHVTWSINSVCHVFGSRPYRSGDKSTNNFICGVVGFGEGWHNNHHAFPTSARHGLKWWQFDSSWIVIRSMQMLGLAWNVKLPSEETLAAKRA